MPSGAVLADPDKFKVILDLKEIASMSDPHEVVDVASAITEVHASA